MRLVALIAVAASLAVAACGAEGDEQAVLDVLEAQSEATVEGDGEAACRDLTREARKLVVVSFEAQMPDAEGVSCESFFEAVAANLTAEGKERIRDANYRIEFRDGRAIADSDATTGETELRKSGGRWVITRMNFGS